MFYHIMHNACQFQFRVTYSNRKMSFTAPFTSQNRNCSECDVCDALRPFVSVCRSCILRHLESSSCCPVCAGTIHRTKGASSLR